jgi:hypothetical protein
MRVAAELELLDLIKHSRTCGERQIGASLGDAFGVVITFEGNQVGIWGWVQCELRFRTLANWDPRITAVDANAALAATIKMAEARNWSS